jgi:tetratricopeptide (TPR) repeat protein
MPSRLEKFRKFVQLDPKSELAQYGLGKALFDEKQYEEAAACFRKTLEIKPDYTAAFLLLGKSLEKLNRKEEAMEIYKIGIAVGDRTGDLEPKHAMETRLMKLEWKGPNPSSH